MSVAVNSTLTPELTAVVLMVKVPCVAPAGMVTSNVPFVALGGMVMLLPVGTGATVVLAVLTVTTAPPVGAGSESSSVPVVIIPPTRTLGEKMKLESCACGDPSVSDALIVVFRNAVIVTIVGVFTAEVRIWKFTLVRPAGTTTGDGKVTSGLLLVRLTGWPGVKAGAEMVTVPTPDEPLAIVALTVSPVTLMSVTGVTVSVACAGEMPDSDAPMLITWVEPTWLVAILNVVVVLPAGTTTLVGRITTPLLAATVTVVPPVGAAEVSVTVAVEVIPPGTVPGLSVIIEMVAELEVVAFGLW